MTREEKNLVLQDICARLPYHVICKITYTDVYEDGSIKKTRRDTYLTCDYIDDYIEGNAECKPYLRPMSSMTEEEKKEYQSLCEIHIEHDADDNVTYYYFDTIESFNWLNKKMFDYRGLIPNLALSTEEFNPYKE